jgi:hypothetical protein
MSEAAPEVAPAVAPHAAELQAPVMTALEKVGGCSHCCELIARGMQGVLQFVSILLLNYSTVSSAAHCHILLLLNRSSCQAWQPQLYSYCLR